MLDLGDTLMQGTTVLPHVPDALQAFQQFRGDDGKPLALCLVSDFDMPTLPATPTKIKPIFARYIAILDQLHLRPFFEPVNRRVTLSTHAGVLKPNRKIFEFALRRLGVAAQLSDCIFITECARHVNHCRQELGMKALQFGKDFTDWSQAPMLVAALAAPGSVNLAPSLRAWSAGQGLESLSGIEEGGEAGVVLAQARRWVPLVGKQLADLDGVHVSLPVPLELRTDANGRLSCNAGQPSPEDVAEAASYVRGLVARGELGKQAGPLATHEVETDPQGRRLLKRRGFSQI